MRAVALLVLFTSSAFAAPIPLSLIWQAPEECPGQADVWSLLSKRMGRVPARPDGTAFAARGVVEKFDQAWRLELQTLSTSGAGNRTLTHSNCEELTKAAVVALALAVDPLLEAPPESVTRAVWLGLGPQASTGVSPFLAPGLGVNVAIDLKLASFDVFLATFVPQRLDLDARAVRVWGPVGGGAAVSMGPRWTRFELRLGLALHGGVISAEAEGVDQALLRSAGFLGIGGRARARVLITSWLALRLTVDATVAVVRPSFRFSDEAVAFEPALFSGAVGLLVELKVW